MTEKARVVMGIDPGIYGAFVVLGLNKGSRWFAMPKAEKARVDLIWSLRDEYDIIFCLLEKVGVMPDEGVVSCFTFGRGDGILVGSLYSAEIPFDEITPQDWHRLLGIPARYTIPKRPKPGRFIPEKEETKSEFKARCRKVAEEMFPKADIVRDNADAYLIAKVALLIRENYVKR